MTNAAIKETTGFGERLVRNLLMLLELPAEAQAAVDDPEHAFTTGHAVTLARELGRQHPLWADWVERCKTEGLSIRLLQDRLKADARARAAQQPLSVLDPRGTQLEQHVLRFRARTIAIDALEATRSCVSTGAWWPGTRWRRVT